MKTLSIIIPTFNEEKFIEAILKAVIKANSLKLKKEIIIVDDGSKDKTLFKVKKFITNNKKFNFKIINEKTNQGKGYAIKKGILNSTGDIVLIQDSDLEYNPKDYPVLLEPFMQNEADVVYGSRFISSKPHRVLYFWHYVINVFLTNLSNMFTNLNLTDMETGYKVFKGDIARNLAKKLESNRFGFEPEITARVAKIKGLKIYEVGISYSGRTYEEGKKINWVDGVKTLGQIVKYNLLRN